MEQAHQRRSLVFGKTCGEALVHSLKALVACLHDGPCVVGKMYHDRAARELVVIATYEPCALEPRNDPRHGCPACAQVRNKLGLGRGATLVGKVLKYVHLAGRDTCFGYEGTLFCLESLAGEPQQPAELLSIVHSVLHLATHVPVVRTVFYGTMLAC